MNKSVSSFSTSVSDFPPAGKQNFLLHFIGKHSVTNNKPEEISAYSGNWGFFNQAGISCLMKMLNRLTQALWLTALAWDWDPLHPPAWGAFLPRCPCVYTENEDLYSALIHAAVGAHKITPLCECGGSGELLLLGKWNRFFRPYSLWNIPTSH